MIYLLCKYLDPDSLTWLRLGHKFISSRVGFAFLTAFFIVLFLVPRALSLFERLGWVNRQRGYMVDATSKEGVPLMGGLFIFLGSVLGILLWCNLKDPYVLSALAGGVWFFVLGFFDDYSKIRSGSSDGGFSRPTKLFLQFAFAIPFSIWLTSSFSPHPECLRWALSIPALAKEPLCWGWAQWIFVPLFLVFVSNSVNLTDGMDGLATAPSWMTFLGLGIFCYLMSHAHWSEYFFFFRPPQQDGGEALNYLARIHAGDLVVVCFALMGALLGFLWHNTFPAEIFMGDTGSMYLGGVMATIFVLSKQELLFPVFGFLFMLENGSVLIQDFGVKYLGRRILFRAPLHEYLKFIGWSEPKIVVRMWILCAIALAVGLLSLKLR